MADIIDITPPTEEELILMALKKAIKENEKALYVLNDKRYQEMQEAFLILSRLLDDDDPTTKIDVHFRPGFKDIGGISFEASDLTIQTFDMDDFKRVVNLADNFEVHPIKGGRIAGSFTFLNVMTKKTR